MNYSVFVPRRRYEVAMEGWLIENMNKNSYAWIASRVLGGWNLCFEHEADLVVFKLMFGV